jgi:hypothetical protein
MFNLIALLSLLITGIYCQNNTIQLGCSTPICVFSNQNLRFGSGLENSINNAGLFVQPWYYSYISNTWYKLTFASYPLDTAIGTGYGSSHWSGSSIVDLYSLTPTNIVNDYSNYIVSAQDSTKTVGYGKIIARRSYTLNGNQIVFENTFSLGRNDSFVKTNTRIINNSSSTINNLLIWVGTRDDYVGLTDVNTKTRGNLINNSFVPITTNYQESHAIMITNTNEGVLFYSETPGVMTSYALCCSFSNVYNTNPFSIPPATPNPTDGSYAAVLPLGNITTMSSGNIIWYYAAGATSSLSVVAESVATAQVQDIIVPTLTTTPNIQPYYELTPSSNVSYSAYLSPSNNPSSSIFESPSYKKTFSSYISPSNNPSNLPSISELNSVSSSASSSPSSYASVSSISTTSSTSSNSPIIPDKILNVQLNNDIVSNFIVINVVSIFIIFGLISISLCCVFGFFIYRKKHYCDECKEKLNKKETIVHKFEKPINQNGLKLAFVEPSDNNSVSSVDYNYNDKLNNLENSVDHKQVKLKLVDSTDNLSSDEDNKLPNQIN